MIFTLGLLSFLQIFYLPGAVAIRSLGYRISFPVFFNAIFPLSLGINFIFILVSTALGIYHTPTMYALFIAEVIALILLGRRRSLELYPAQAFRLLKSERVIYLIAFLGFAYYASRWIKSFGSVIHWTDAALSWNRWALEWTQSTFPTITRLYPQVISAIYSIPYQFTGNTEVEFFTLTAITSFPIVVSAGLLVNSFYFPKIRWLLLSAMLMFLYSVNRLAIPLSGYADAPLASIAILLVSNTFIQNECDADGRTESRYYLGSVIAGILALIKHLGVPFIFFYPILISLVRGRWIGFRSAIQSVLISGLIALTWYGIKFIDILKGEDIFGFSGIVTTVTRPVSERLPSSLQLLHDNFAPSEFGFIVVVLFYLLVLYVFLEGAIQSFLTRVFLALFIGAFLFWAFVAPYDTRNISIGIPFLAFLVGLTVSGRWINKDQTHERAPQYTFSFKKSLIAVVVVSVGIAQVVLKDEVLLEHQRVWHKIWKSRGD